MSKLPGKSPAKDYDAAARWAEYSMVLVKNSPTALRGDAAAAYGRSVLQRAAGRRGLDGTAEPGEPSPRRQVRLPRSVSDRVDRLAAARGCTPSEIMRDAITSYVQQ